MQTEKTGHLAWCALVALALARRDGRVPSPALENLFLTRWLATALRQRRFSREVGPDIECLLKQGRRAGPGAALSETLEALWRVCTGEPSGQSDLFRLTRVLEDAKAAGWRCGLFSEREWAGRYAVPLDPGVNGAYLLHSGLDAAFDDDGRQTGPLFVRLTGEIAVMERRLRDAGWLITAESDTLRTHLYRLSADGGDRRRPA